jgi:MFS family permease
MVKGAWRTTRMMLVCGGVILALSFGIRHGFGLFLQPVSLANGWGREVFSLAIAVQNLTWGVVQPFTGMLADRIGAGKLVLAGSVFYVAGLLLMSLPQTPTMFVLSAGVLIGIGLSGSSFPIVFGAIGRMASPQKRSLFMGIVMAVGSFGQFIMVPGSFVLIETFDWSNALIGLAVLAAFMAPLSLALFENPSSDTATITGPSAVEAMGEAFSHRGFWLLTLGFFVCGFQVVFIGTHLPAFLNDNGHESSLGMVVLALVGLVNVAGTYYAGLWGGRMSKPKLLVWIYLGRGVAITLFVLLPITTWSAYLFGVFMGLFWLSTIPLTNGAIATIFGVRNMSMLAGFVFFSHQLGSFFGGWLGGFLYDRFGSYDTAWSIAVGLSVLAAILNAPVKEQPIQRLAAPPLK